MQIKNKGLASIFLVFLTSSILGATAVGGDGDARNSAGVLVAVPEAFEEDEFGGGGRYRRHLAEASNLASRPVEGGALAPFTNNEFDIEYCIERNNSLVYNITSDERNMGRWINDARKSKGMPSLKYHADLVVEAQRWAKYLAEEYCNGDVETREHISTNIWCDTYDELGEYVISSRSIRKSGAFTSLMRNRGRAYVLYKPYERYGIGIRRCGKWYYVVLLFKNRSY
jgi:hypothetical protein